MARPRSLRQRVLIAFGVLTVVLVPVMLLSFHGVFHASEDSVFDQQLEEEVRSLLLQPERLRQPSCRSIGTSRLTLALTVPHPACVHGLRR